MSDYRLSLVAQFDDLVRKKNVLCSGAEEWETQIYNFVKQQEMCRQKWVDAEERSREMSRQKDEMSEQNAKLETKLMHAKGLIDTEIRKRLKLENDNSAMDNNIRAVCEILKDNQSVLNVRDRERLAHVSTLDYIDSFDEGTPDKRLSRIDESARSPDITWDNTADDLDLDTYKVKNGSNRKKRQSELEKEETTPHDKKRPKANKSPSKAQRKKKHRRSNSASIITTVTVDGNGSAKAQFTHEDVRRRDSTLRKCPSAGDIKMVDSEEEITPNKGRYSRDVNTPGRPSGLYRSTSAWSLNRPHDFVKTAVLRPEQCVWCDKYMFVRFLKCKGLLGLTVANSLVKCGKKMWFSKSFLKCRECKVTAHLECKDQVPTPCVPHNVTPGNIKASEMTLSDYAPISPPYIPALVIHCIKEIEARGLNEIGLYRQCGNEREIKQLKADFLKHRGLPNLSSVADVHVMCGCVKDFLRGLKETLLTNRLRADFVRAAQNIDDDEGLSGTIQAISKLPNANRDTLAYIIVHLQRISESEECKMNISNLAIVLGPTIVGYSQPDLQPEQMINETNNLAMVMQRLIGLSRDYWERLIAVDDDYQTPSYCVSQTPEVLRSILGPVNTPGDSSTVDRNKSTWNTPRYGSVSRNQRRNITQYFASPIQ